MRSSLGTDSISGRFLVPQSGDDILFGNTFDRPLKLPWGTSAILKFMQYVFFALELLCL